MDIFSKSFINQSHYGLKDLYEVSCKELDFLVKFFENKNFIYGSRNEAMILPRKHYSHIGHLNAEEDLAFAEIIKKMCIRYGNLFETSFPYSSGIHQQPTDGKDYPEWHFHMSFYPPLLRFATIKKFMVGYEMFAGPQRDITAEQAAENLKSLPEIHYSKR